MPVPFWETLFTASIRLTLGLLSLLLTPIGKCDKAGLGLGLGLGSKLGPGLGLF